MMRIDELKIAVLGGDKREEILVQALIAAGASVMLVGYPKATGAMKAELSSALSAADAIIAPMSNTDPDGVILAVPTEEKIQLSAELLAQAKPGVPFLIGKAKPKVRTWIQRANLKLVELGELDELAILNAVPTAEGAVQLAMEKMPITVQGSRALVLGFGRCGSSLAKLLAAMGAKTAVAARSASQLALVRAWGLASVKLAQLEAEIGQFQVIFNTIPALVLTERLLAKTRAEVLIIDLASAPGGVDFAAAERMQREALLALGLPGKVAPVSAGKILAEVIPSLLCELVQSRE